MRYRFVFDETRCSACSACVVACMDQKDLYPLKGDLSFRRCETREELKGGRIHMRYLSIGCMHCESAKCIEVCPSGCFFRDEETGFVLYDNTDCISCRKCLEECPFEAPVFSEDRGKMEKCDGCAERVKHGLSPACVQVCPFDALQLIEN